MTGGRLKLNVVAGGAVVPPFQIVDAVHTGILDGGHGSAGAALSKHRAYALFGNPPPFGWDSHGFLGWFYQGGGEALHRTLVNDMLKLNVTGLLCFPAPTQPSASNSTGFSSHTEITLAEVVSRFSVWAAGYDWGSYRVGSPEARQGSAHGRQRAAPMSVRRDVVERRCLTSAISRSRPMNWVNWRGRLWANASSDRKGGNSLGRVGCVR